MGKFNQHHYLIFDKDAFEFFDKGFYVMSANTFDIGICM